jgi:hypothetical protein
MRLSLFIVVSVLLSVTAAAQKTRGIRSVDFRNFTYETNGSRFVLRDGKYYEGEPGSWHSYSLSRVTFVDFNGDGNDEAFIVVDYRTSGTLDNAQDYYVFGYRRGIAQLTFHDWREKPCVVRVKARKVVITAPFWKDTGLCCPSGIETSVYRWRNAKFVRISHRQRYMDPNTKWWLIARRA